MSVPKPVWPLFPPQPLWSSVSVSAAWETLGQAHILLLLVHLQECLWLDKYLLKVSSY